MNSVSWLLAVSCMLLIHTVSGKCPNFCNGHGRCSGPNKCDCFSGYDVVGDCSQRSCPHGNAWVDIAKNVDEAHSPAECSNRGICDRKTGTCDCFEGYSGIACNRMMCPNACNGHGVCRSMRYHAQNVILGLPRFSYDNPWDAEMIFGCECDRSWQGFDCSLRTCPYGDDPLIEDELDEIQLLRCDEEGDEDTEFFLDFKGELTGKLDGSFTAADIQEALEKLTTIESVRVNMHTETGATTVCSLDEHGPPSRGILQITFKNQFDPLPRLVARDTDGNKIPRDPSDVSKTPRISTAAFGEGLTFLDGDISPATLVSQRATKQSLVCSGRGNCNTKTGECQCYTGFTSSDGRGNLGNRGDCGYAKDIITSCPGVNIECSGHGSCSGDPEYKCTCEKGWIGGDCQKRACPKGNAWFDQPVADGEAHSLAECSNKGVCNRDTGKCKCQPRFTGEACEQMECPQSDTEECNGHGRCLSMAQLADFATDNGVPVEASYGFVPANPETWDAKKVFGCLCDDGWQEHDCSRRTCPFGDDVTTKKQETETQRLTCIRTDPGSLKLTFRGEKTNAIDATSGPDVVKDALMKLTTIGKIIVTFSDGVDELCPFQSNNDITVTFLTDHGDLPPIQAVEVESSIDTFQGASTSSFFEEIVKGTTENDECNGRGICNRNTGYCKCFNGFGSSDGMGGPGGRNDCGYREPFFLRNGNSASV